MSEEELLEDLAIDDPEGVSTADWEDFWLTDSYIEDYDDEYDEHILDDAVWEEV